MQLPTTDSASAKREPQSGRSTRIWTVHAVERITGFGDDGMRTVVPAGTYILREIDDITYELHDATAPPLLTLRLSEVAAFWKSGVLLIDGLWP